MSAAVEPKGIPCSSSGKGGAGDDGGGEDSGGEDESAIGMASQLPVLPGEIWTRVIFKFLSRLEKDWPDEDEATRDSERENVKLVEILTET